MMRMPSMKRLVSDLNLSIEDAHFIRAIGHAVDRADALKVVLDTDPRTAPLARDVDGTLNAMWRRTYALRAMNAILGTHGVEGIGGHDTPFSGPPYEYLNAGDTYATTLIWTRATDTIRIGCWGDIAERMSCAE